MEEKTLKEYGEKIKNEMLSLDYEKIKYYVFDEASNIFKPYLEKIIDMYNLWKDGYEIPVGLEKAVSDFYTQNSIMVTKQTKKSTLELDLKPGIYEMKAAKDSIYILVDASSSGNIKPTLLIEAFYSFIGKEFDP